MSLVLKAWLGFLCVFEAVAMARVYGLGHPLHEVRLHCSKQSSSSHLRPGLLERITQAVHFSIRCIMNWSTLACWCLGFVW
jgi:hypothetical protein